MKKGLALAIAILLISTFYSLSLTQGQVTRITGVHAGDWINYSLSATGNVSGIWIEANEATLYIDEVDISQTLLTCHIVISYENGTTTALPSYQVDVDSGVIDPVDMDAKTIGKLPITASNLGIGSSVFNSGEWSQYSIKETISSSQFNSDPSILKIGSDAMAPTLKKDDLILLDTSTNMSDLRYTYPNSDIIGFTHTEENGKNQTIVLRITSREIIDGKVYYSVKGDSWDPPYPSVVSTPYSSHFGEVSADSIIGKVISNFQANSSYQPVSPVNHARLSKSVTGGNIYEDVYFDQGTGLPLLGVQAFSSNGLNNYTVSYTIIDSNSIIGASNGGTISGNTLNLQPVSFIKPLTTTPEQAIVATTVGTSVIAVVSAGSFLFAAVSEAPGKLAFDRLPDFIKRYIKGAAGKKLEELFDVEENRKSALITIGEIAVLIVAVSFIALVLAFVDVKGYPQILSVSLFLGAFYTALASAIISQTFSFFGDILCSYHVRAQKKLKLWSLGTLTWFVSGLAQVPFSCPSISKTLGDYKYKVGLQQRVALLNTAVKALIASFLFLPFALMATNKTYDFVSHVGSVGLFATAITLSLTLMPFKPFAGKEIRKYNLPVSIGLSVASVILVVAQYPPLALVDTYTYICLGFFGLFALIPVLLKLKSEKVKLAQSYPELWFKKETP